MTSAYGLTIGIVAITTPYLISKYDVRKLFMDCMSIFLIVCVMSYFAPNFFILVFSRIVQGLGAGVLFSLTQIVMIYIFTKNSQAKALSYIGVVIGLTPCIGPIIAGYIIDFSSWRNIFLLLIIISLFIIVLASKYVEDIHEHKIVKMDLTSVFTLDLGVLFIMLAITDLSDKMHSDTVIIPLIIGILFLLYFVQILLKSRDSFLKLDLFYNPLFHLGNFLLYIAFFAWVSGALLIPLFLQSAIGVSAIIRGFIILPATLLKALLNPLGSRFYKRFGGHKTSILGSSLLIISCIPFVFFSVNANLNLVAILYMIRIIGIILLLFSMLAFSLKGIGSEEYTQGLSIINSNRQIVAALGTTALLAGVSAISPNGTVSIQGINLAFFAQLIIFIVALLISILFIKPKTSEE